MYKIYLKNLFQQVEDLKRDALRNPNLTGKDLEKFFSLVEKIKVLIQKA